MGRGIVRAGALLAVAVLALGACSSPANTLEGRWRDAHQNVYEFQPAGNGAFTGEIVQGDTDVCLPAHIKVTGANGRYKGSEAYQTVVGGKCTGKSAGDGGIGLTVAADGKTVAVTHTPPGAVACTNCAPETWTKVPTAGGVPWLLILIVVLILLVAAGAYAVFWRRRHSRRPPPPGAGQFAPPPDYRFSAPPATPTSGSSE